MLTLILITTLHFSSHHTNNLLETIYFTVSLSRLVAAHAHPSRINSFEFFFVCNFLREQAWRKQTLPRCNGGRLSQNVSGRIYSKTGVYGNLVTKKQNIVLEIPCYYQAKRCCKNAVNELLPYCFHLCRKNLNFNSLIFVLQKQM